MKVPLPSSHLCGFILYLTNDRSGSTQKEILLVGTVPPIILKIDFSRSRSTEIPSNKWRFQTRLSLIAYPWLFRGFLALQNLFCFILRVKYLYLVWIILSCGWMAGESENWQSSDIAVFVHIMISLKTPFKKKNSKRNCWAKVSMVRKRWKQIEACSALSFCFWFA